MDKIFGSVGILMQDDMQGHGAKEVVCGKGGKWGMQSPRWIQHEGLM